MPTFTQDDLADTPELIVNCSSTDSDARVEILPAPRYREACLMRRSLRLRQRGQTRRTPRPTTSPRTRGSRRTRTQAPSRGDPDDGDPDPGEPARAGRGDLTKGRRHCLGCGHVIDHKRPQARYCGDACRMRYVRAGRVAADPHVPVQVLPLAQVLGEINRTAGRRQAAWLGRADDDTAVLTERLQVLWDVARRARADCKAVAV